MGRFQMTVNEWVESFWAVLNVRHKTLHDFKPSLQTPFGARFELVIIKWSVGQAINDFSEAAG